MSKNKLTPKFWCALTVFSLMGQVAWVVENMYFNVFVYKMFNASPGQISAMVSASAVAATLTTVFIGALSDRVGKRKLFICGGYILWGISIFSFILLRMDYLGALVPLTSSAMVSLVIVLDCIMTFFGSSANDAAFNAWVTDSTDSSNRGAAEGINAMMPLVAILVVFGGFMSFDLNASASWTAIFIIIGLSTFLVGIFGFFIIDDVPTEKSKTGYFYNIVYGFLPKTVCDNKILYLTFFGFIIFNISIQIFMPYLILYYEISLGMTNYVLIMAPAIIIASVITVLWGKFYDKKGFKLSAVIAIFWLCAGYSLLYASDMTLLVFIGSLLMMSGYLSGMAVFGAMIRDNTPTGKSGMLQGIRIFSQVFIPGIVGPFIGKLVLSNAEVIMGNDGTQSFIPNADIFAAALFASLALLVYVLVINTKKPPVFNELTTPFEVDFDKDKPWDVYPRPQLKRDSFISLNGRWKLEFENKNGKACEEYITVPFPPESKLSGVSEKCKNISTFIYSRNFDIECEFVKERVIIHFGAVDQYAKVYINGKLAGEHHGGYIPFEFDITELISVGENTLVVEAEDNLDTNYPYGKQRKKRGGMWYTPVSGIWQTVWLESVPENYIENLKITTNGNKVTLKITGGISSKTLRFNDISKDFTGSIIEFTVDNPEFWSPESPKLYYFSLLSGDDSVESYFALRDISIEDKGKNKYIALNGKPYFFHGLLDQGYFSDGIYLPATPEGYRFDILKMKELGFNMLRKHIKIEPDIFYYYCDLYGMIVFQDFVNSGRYNFFFDTALPTAFLKTGITHFASKRRRELFEKTGKDIVNLLHNHPSVCYYTIFNEGWGQYDSDKMYTEFKNTDPTRIWDATSGWFKYKKSDVQSEHIYFKPIKFKSVYDKPLVLSEFGGYSYKLKDNSFNLSETYGYKFYDNKDMFTADLKRLYFDEIAPAIENGLCATVLTQVSDVEDETNGLVTYDRQVVKVPKETMIEISDKIFSTFNKLI